MQSFLSRIPFFALLAVAVLFIGCDGGGPDVDVADVPVVSFVGSGKTVTEQDSTASIGVTISGSPESAVRVEVLFAAQASTAGPEDVGGFTTQAVTFPAGAEAGAIEEITFDLNVELEPGEGLQAYFALQQLEGPARIGEGREFALRIGQNVIPIAEARAQALESVVTVEGTITRLEGGDVVYIQDETAGIALYAPEDGGLYDEAAAGAQVQVTGETTEFGGLFQIGNLQEYAILSEGNDLPEPATITVEELLADGETYESTLVRIEGLTTDAEGSFQAGGAEGNYTVSDGTGEVTLRIPDNSFYGGQPIPEDEFTFEGVLNEYFTGYQLLALLEGDLIYGDDGGNGDDDDDEPELITIAEARTMSDGEVVRVQGIVTRIEGSNARIQDESGADGAAGIVVRSDSLAGDIEGGAVSPGDRIEATGTLSAYNGLLQINAEAGELAYEVVTEDAGLPAPQSVSSLAEIGEDYESELVQVEGLTIETDEETFSTEGGDGFGNYTITDGEGGELLLRIPFGSFYVGEPIPDGAVTFTGVVGQFNGVGPGAREPDTGYQLFAIAEGDIEETGDGGEGAEVILSEDFQEGTGPNDLGVFSPFSVASDSNWTRDAYEGAGYAYINGYGAGEASNDWLISPALNFDGYTGETLSFVTATNFDGPELDVLVSTNYDGSGNPEDFDWTDITDRATLSETDYTWTESGDIDVSEFAGSAVYIAFQYDTDGTGGGEAATWEVDDILVEGTPVE